MHRVFGLLFLVLACASTGNANFAIFQVAATAPDVSCNIVTGVATGTGAGTCVASPPTCNGSADDAAAFAAFNDWAVNTWQASHTGLIQLFIPSGKACELITDQTSGSSDSALFAKGILKLRISGYGATLGDGGGNGFQLGGFGICHKGIAESDGCSARIATVSAGATNVTLLNSALNTRFTIGQWVIVTGLDLQGFGYPPNAHYFDYAKVSGISGATISLDRTLAYSYKSTWPVYFAGSNLEADQGGPGTIYALDPSWDTEVEVRGLTIAKATALTYANGRSITYRDVIFTGSGCGVPTQNLSWSVINGTMTGCSIEADKLVGLVSFTGGVLNTIEFQSSSINALSMSGITVSGHIGGTPKAVSISNSTLASFFPGALGYGRTDTVVCNVCAIADIGVRGVLDKGAGDNGVNNTYSMSGGIITVPNVVSVSSAANNGSGLIRLTVTSTSAFITGKYASVGASSGDASCSGTWQLTIIDATHVDLVGSTFVATCSGSMGNVPLRWAIPGTNLFWTGQFTSETAFRVVDVTQDASNTYVQTTLAGTFPGVPLDTGKLYIQVHPAPQFTCTSCTGAVDAVDLSQAPAGAPIYSYSRRTYTGNTIGFDGGPISTMALWGAISSLTFNVSTAYTGINNPLTYHWPAVFDNYPSLKADFSVYNYAPIINLRASGTRVVTPAGVTGTQSGDSGLAVPEAVWFTEGASAGASADISGENPSVWPSVTVTIQTDQGVVNP